jgi:2-dehydropantoate 2-reductase
MALSFFHMEASEGIGMDTVLARRFRVFSSLLVSAPVKVGIVGAGAIGCYVGGRLRACGGNVVFFGRPRVRTELETNGLDLQDGAGNGATLRVEPAQVDFVTEVAGLAACDVLLVCVKSAQSAEVAADLNGKVRDDALVVSMQNGLGNAETLRKQLPRHTVLGGIVGFNVVSSQAGAFRRATTGPLVIEATADVRVDVLARALRAADLETEVVPDIRAKQWSKLVMNLNNAVSALTGAPTQQLIFDASYRRIVRAVTVEALDLIKRAGHVPSKVGPLPVQLFPFLLGLPSALLRIVARAQVKIDPSARSSMWEDLTRGRLTEVDYLNGEIVRLAASIGAKAPINQRIIELVRDAERAAKGPPNMSADALWQAIRS